MDHQLFAASSAPDALQWVHRSAVGARDNNVAANGFPASGLCTRREALQQKNHAETINPCMHGCSCKQGCARTPPMVAGWTQDKALLAVKLNTQKAPAFRVAASGRRPFRVQEAKGPYGMVIPGGGCLDFCIST
jgi:hypothetical protein